ncbi:MAG: ABC transporter ATP-binding protein [Crocinitomicaceae bacterium]|jgi:lipoprotein-releasing system ATP-binding protein|nr:ABC transporter ATP-binding protein [Cryomorphaceae bacterium]MCF8269510.1 ABC transporter ATP-binding protein [Crocinitomicaceae bacterium]
MLNAVNLTKKYGELEILKGISLEVNAGEIVSIVGSSGAGKTTLLQILGTLDRPDEGTFTIDGVNPFSLSQRELAKFRNQKIGFVFQFHQLLPEFDAIENIMIPAMIQGISKKEAREKAYLLLEKVGLQDRASHRPNEISGGEQQRIAVCRALVNQPNIVFADEPSGNLDSKNANELHELFFKLREELNQSFVIVTHNQELAQQADRMLRMQDGKMV